MTCGYDIDGNLHGPYLEKNPDGSIKKQGQYVHGVFYTGKSLEKKRDPVRHVFLRSLEMLKSLPLESAQEKGRYRHAQQSLALLYQSLQKKR